MSQLDARKSDRRVVKRFEPVMDAQRRLIARWSCSTMLLRYLQVRTSTLRQSGCSPRSRHKARRLGTWPSRVTLRGARGCEESVLRKNALAAAAHGRVATGSRGSCPACRQRGTGSASGLELRYRSHPHATICRQVERRFRGLDVYKDAKKRAQIWLKQQQPLLCAEK